MLRVLVLISIMAAVFAPQGHASCLVEPDMPREVCSPVEVFVYLDRKSVVAGEGLVLVAAELVTRSGGSPPDGFQTHFHIRRGKDVSSRIAFAEAGLVQAHLPVGDIAGPLEVWIEAGDVASSPQRLDVVPALPAPFVISLTGCEHSAVCLIAAQELRDLYGNQLPDGLIGTLTTHVNGALVSQQSVQTIRGSVFAPWRQPEGETNVSLIIAGVRANLLVMPNE